MGDTCEDTDLPSNLHRRKQPPAAPLVDTPHCHPAPQRTSRWPLSHAVVCTAGILVCGGLLLQWQQRAPATSEAPQFIPPSEPDDINGLIMMVEGVATGAAATHDPEAFSVAEFDATVLTRFAAFAMATPPDCVDSTRKCVAWAAGGECENNPDFMRKSCPASCKSCSEQQAAATSGKPQRSLGRATGKAAEKAKGEARVGPTPRVKAAAEVPKAKAAEKPCADSDMGCTAWAASGECENNPGFMLPTCRKSCDSCDLEARCAFNHSEVT
jgi:hypothetical protein